MRKRLSFEPEQPPRDAPRRLFSANKLRKRQNLRLTISKTMLFGTRQNDETAQKFFQKGC